ncbi:hypothetical protein DID88_003001 [Monilinia fructigena]|uniref:C2H2-type domain-containing protein n=1 Tax=Monilinia fructigena TaxID=38457 RepID=A0A395IE92_9HELO|nr:hypothetical protein DID88_003001 [Monilinia fructigena]
MTVYCAPCNRPFNGQQDLDQHIRNSSAHKKRRPQGQKPFAPDRVELAKPQHALSIRTSTERQRPQPLITTASSFSTSKITSPVITTDPRVVNSPWSPVAVFIQPRLPVPIHGNAHDVIKQKQLAKSVFFIQRNEINGMKRSHINVAKPREKVVKTLPTHDFQLSLQAIRHKDYRKTPPASGELKFRAVTVDCEMAGIAGGMGEVVMLCVIDYITGVGSEGGIHDCLEDVLATREVVVVCTRHKEAFQTWAKRKNSEELRLQKERERRRQEKEDEQARKGLLRARGGSSNRIYLSSDDEDEEILRWSDIAEDLGWPHPDTGYDPWSD